LGGLLDFEPHLPVVDQKMNAGRERCEDFRVRQRDAAAGAGRGVEVEADPVPLFDGDRTLGQASDPQLGPLQVGENRNGAPGLLLNRAHDVVALLMLLVAAVAEVEAEHVGPGLEQGANHLGAGACRS
jgi:hypothetical protein